MMGHLWMQEVLLLFKLIGVFFLVYLVTSSFATWHRLRRFRGPLLAQFSYFYMLRVVLSGNRGERYRNLYDKYGGEAFLRIGPNDLLVSSPAMVRHMNSVRSPYLRSDWYRAQRFDPYRDNLLSLSDTAQHDKLKAQLAFGYSGKENPAIETGVDEQVEKLVALIRRKYISTASKFRPLDLAPTTMFFTVDTISRIAFGKAFGNLDEGRDIYSFHEFAEAASMKGSAFSEIPWLGNVFFYPPVLRLIGPKVTDKKGVGMFMRFADEVLNKRIGPNAEDKKDMLGSFIRHGVSSEQCKSEIVFQILAGSDTTAHAIRATMLNIITSPRVYGKVRVEIDAAIADGRIQSSPAKAEEVKQLPYMQAVIWEGLRFSPPTTALIQKQVPPEGDTFDGRFLPGGTRMAVNILPIQRSKEVFGQDSDVFRPERWLDISDEKYREMSQTVNQVFGWGRWQCLGKPVAMLELNKIFVELLRYFDFELVNPQSPWKSIDYTLYVVSDFWVRVTERCTPV
ncbi:cytochrome P450 [Hypoxylon cercidicola]|nr:cytochrome P450 [Hypoxylon cercidicola]